MAGTGIRTTVLYAKYTDLFSYYDDWKDAFSRDARFDSTLLNICDGKNRKRLKETVGDCDFLVLLHSTNADVMEPIEAYKDILLRRKCKLLVLVGNEVNLPGSPMGRKIAFLKDIRAEFIGTQLLPEAGRWLYGECPGAKVIALPHALNPDVFAPRIPQGERRIDVGVRSHRYLPLLGDNDRNDLFSFFQTTVFDPPLRLDIETESRCNRESWADFLNSCKATISTEAGSHYLERDDRTVKAIREYISGKCGEEGIYVVRRGSALERLGLKMPGFLRRKVKSALKDTGIKQEFQVEKIVGYDEIYPKFFKDRERAPVYGKAISSRHFDAIGTKTCQIMFAGRYNDILKAGEHYIVLKRDFSNIDEVLARFRDDVFRTAMVDRAYGYVMEEHTHRNRLSVISTLP